MPIQFLCPTCRKHYTVADQLAGTTVQCQACQQLMAVPAAPPSPTAPSGLGPSPALEASQPLPTVTKSSGLPKTAWVAIAATLLVAVIVAVAVIVLNNKSSAPDKQLTENTNQSQSAPTSKNSTDRTGPDALFPTSTKNSSNASPNEAPAGPLVSQAGPAVDQPAKNSAPTTTPPTQAKSDPANGGNKLARNQPASTASPSTGWTKRFVPKSDDSPASASRAATPAVSAAPTIWHVKPDPAPQQITSGDIKWADVEVPVLEWGHGMVSPTRPSPFVAVYGEDRGKRHVGTVDLRDGKKKGPFAIEARGRELPKLSFNGKLLAWLQIGDAVIQIHSLDDGKPGRRITPGDKAEFRWYDFTDGTHLVTYTTEFGNKAPRLELWSVTSGESVRNFDLPADFEGQNFEAAAVSPGGAYVALGMKSALYIYEVATGKLVGELRLPPLSERDQEARHAGFQGLAFSWDGAELSAMLYSLGNSHFVVWATDNGKVAANVQTSQRLPAFGRKSGPRLEWFGSDGLLVDGNLVFHRESLRQPVDELKGRTEFRRVLSWDRGVAIDSGKRARGLSLQTVKLRGDELAKRAATLKAGGELVETGLPQLKLADSSGLMQIDLAAKPSAWSVQVEPVQATSGVESQINLSLGQGDVIKKSLIKATHALALRQTNEGGANRSLDRYDLRNGNQDSTMVVYSDCQLFDMSRDGKLALLRTGSQSPRLDIINLDDRKHVVGWKPYADFPGEKESAGQLDRAMFVDNEHVVTIRKMNELVVWKVPECKAQLIVIDAWNLQVLANGRYFLARAPGDSAWAIHETLTGRPCGRIPFGQDLDLIDDIAIDPQGKRMAILRHQPAHSSVVLIDLTTGARSGDVALPPPSRRQRGSIHWVGTDYLLIDDHLLADVARGGYMLNYTFEGEMIQSDAGDPWIVSGPRRQSLTLAEIPSDKALKHSESAQIPKPSLTKGGRISLSGTINVPGVNKDAFLKTVYDTLVQRGFVVDPQAPIRLHVEAAEQGTGQTMQLRTFGQVQGKSEFSIAGLEIPVKAVLSMPGGGQYTVYQTRYTNQSMFVRLKQDQNPEQYLQDEMRESFTRSANTISAPLYAFDAPAEPNAPRVTWKDGQEMLLPPGMLEAQATAQ
jgi:hypothetical protein